jgi:hypothetical protein
MSPVRRKWNDPVTFPGMQLRRRVNFQFVSRPVSAGGIPFSSGEGTRIGFSDRPAESFSR